MESVEASVNVVTLQEPVRGPGGHWYRYMATRGDKKGYGDTAREARLALKAKEEGVD